MREFLQYKCKDRIIYNVLVFLDTKNEHNKTSAISDIEKLAKFYNIELRKKQKQATLKAALLEFIKMNNGYVDTLPLLYNLLK